MKVKTLPTVLVVEDETLIRMDAVFMIEDAGFRTVVTSGLDDIVFLSGVLCLPKP
ncbi:hypothetical protein [Pseudorhodobacter turbinis]|uniref:hypothetical protein n=1 Tax=Pseudorhodobacter turbinis TaxID=2500533 RepID=UPI00143DA003|nr:hypothetical protein [Pseudorhodobacter turbinis]